MVTYKARVNPRGIIGVPCKHINISSQKNDQLLFFLRRQLEADLEKSLRAIVNDKLSKLSHLISLAGSLSCPAEVVGCYKFPGAEDSAWDLYEMAATIHCLAMA